MNGEDESSSGKRPRVLLDEARAFVNAAERQSGEPLGKSYTEGLERLAGTLHESAQTEGLFNFTQRLSRALLAMESEVKTLGASEPESKEKVAAGRRSGAPHHSLDPEAALHAEVNELRDIIGHLLVTAEPSWEQGIHGRDWKEAMDRAREALSVGFRK